ncbi:MAG: hypothetical protein AAGA56_06340 [Myxococcota bacterium]
MTAAAVLLAACVTVERVPGPDGREALLIRCSDEADCMRRAADECGGKYELIKSGSDTWVQGNARHTMSSTEHSLTVQCPNAPPADRP